MSRDERNEQNLDERPRETATAHGATSAGGSSTPQEIERRAESGSAIVVPLAPRRVRGGPTGNGPNDDDPGPAAA